MEPLGIGDPQWAGAFRLLARLGEGGMGEVFLGRTALGGMAAVKLINPGLARDPDFRRRFRLEVDATRRASSHWTAPVLAADVEADRPWVATSFVEGLTLGEAVEEMGGSLPEATVLSMADGLCRALENIHSVGLIHRDLKPSNVMLTRNGPLVIDFGIVRATDRSAITRTDILVGSPGFMSPEQASGLEIGPPSDVFSLGCVLAFAATGRPPFGSAGDNGMPAVLLKIVNDDPVLDGMPAPLRPLVAACLSKSPADRPSPAQLRKIPAIQSAVASASAEFLPPILTVAVARRVTAVTDFDPGRRSTPAAQKTPMFVPLHDAATETAPKAPQLPASTRSPHQPALVPVPPSRRLRPTKPKARLLVTALVGLLVGTLMVAIPLFSHRTGDKPKAKAPATVLGAVPEGLLGDWEGTVESDGALQRYIVTITQAWVGGFVVNLRRQGPGTEACSYGLLVSGGDKGIMFNISEFGDIPSHTCSADGQTITPLDADHIQYQTDTGTWQLTRI
ncbi:protein kinase [Streptomyces sp. NPDC001552]|uniref:serine/threonine-protein kinase n=1 Tax=Streptomyces sp. NPDC001552 TaxID=3364587 RepID=UPI0036765C5D